ncbi:hypothetical protein ACFQVD_08370 [Streptosporangium amethystogenes subsp. fukuiense]|uniref:Uncharacterized protein n=1 Tax=Streptosporangium amethystogenes subsp. fukuiense TaxID=698418 RepID=A0ABW2SXB3_9ACTN
MPLISVRAAVVFGAAFVLAVTAAALVVADGSSWPKALGVAGATFGIVLAAANNVIASPDDQQHPR